MNKYLNKYRIPSARLSNWDYGQSGLYFITICTHKRIRFFGKIDNPIVETRCIASLPKIHLSEIGKIVEYEWLNTFELRRDMNLYMGEFVVMPDHFHAIIGIGENAYNTPNRRDAMRGCGGNGDAMHRVSARDYKNQFGFQSKNLASIIRGFKSAVKMGARKIHPDFEWQSRFHDHIIRDDLALNNISKYIIENPLKWKD